MSMEPRKLIQHLEALYKGNDLSQADAFAIFSSVMQGQLDHSQLAALLISLKIKGEIPAEIAGAADAMRANAASFARPDYDFADIVGTGGDGHNTINISSAAAIVAASCGIKVAKHGNRSVSSKSGSADLFAQFGYELMSSPDIARQCLDNANFCFLFAPVYHAGVKHAMPVRTSLKTRTLFNILGPLANPAKPSHSVLGVYSPELLQPYADVAQRLAMPRALIVHGSGLDEIAVHGETAVIEIDGEQQTQYSISPADFGFTEYPLSAITGGEPEVNRQMIANVLAGQGQSAHEAAIATNAAALIHLHGKTPSLAAAAEQAVDAMRSGKALATIEAAAKQSQTASTEQ